MSGYVLIVFRRRSTVLALIGLSLALLFPAMAAAACETWRDEYGVYRSNCRFSGDLRLVKDMEVKFLKHRGEYTIHLPDLTPDKYKYYVSGYDVEVSIDIRNDGLAATRATTVAVTLQFWDPSRSTQYGQDSEIIAQVPVINPGTTSRVYVTTLTLPDLINDFDVVAAGAVDPTSTAHPTGTQLESDESDNALMHACRVYGTNPVQIPTPPPVCN
jgi:hypothetical protein